jgi:hypothetical protein
MWVAFEQGEGREVEDRDESEGVGEGVIGGDNEEWEC